MEQYNNRPRRFNTRLILLRVTVWVMALFILITLLNMLGIPNPFFNPFSRPKAVPKPVTIITADLGADEQNTIEIFKRMSPSVVYITSSRLFRNRLTLNVYDIPQGTGTGFIWDHDGFIVTNFHVIQDADDIQVKLQDGSFWRAHLIGVDPDNDLAVIRIQAPKSVLQPVIIGSSKELQVGQKVLAIGNPFGLDSTLTTGIISALGREITTEDRRRIYELIQTDAAINPGNSGGPLLDSFGRVIGVNTAIVSEGRTSAGIGMAVPIDTVNRVIPYLISNGKVPKPYLGISPVAEQVSRTMGIQGAVIHTVLPGTPAEKAGLRGVQVRRDGDVVIGDIIQKVDETAIDSFDELVNTLSKYEPGDVVTLSVLREDTTLNIDVNLDAR